MDTGTLDAGPPPQCFVSPFVRHVLDRPGGALVGPPGGIVRVRDGFLAGYHRVESTLADSGTGSPDASMPATDEIDLIHISDDGIAGAPRVISNGAATGYSLRGPVVLTSGDGAIAVFQRSRHLPGDPGFEQTIQSAWADSSGAPGVPRALRDRYALPTMAALAAGDLLGVAFDLGPPSDSGIVVVRPVSLMLRADGSDLRTFDVDLNAVVPFDLADPFFCASDDGSGFYVYRDGGALGFLRFQADGALGGRGVYTVAGSSVPRLDDAAAASDALFGVWAESSGAHTSVHVVVSSAEGTLRAQTELEGFDGEGPTVASVTPAYGGVAVFWRRGVDSSARLRVAIVSPQGTVRVAPTELLLAPHLEGRVVAWVSGRDIAFIARDGLPPAWGYLFGRTCLPAM